MPLPLVPGERQAGDGTSLPETPNPKMVRPLCPGGVSVGLGQTPASQTSQAWPLRPCDSHAGTGREAGLLPPLPADVGRLCRAGVQTEQQLQREDGEYIQIPRLPASAQPGKHSR